MHDTVDVGVLLVDREVEIYGPGRGGVDDGHVIHEVPVEAVEISGGGDEAVAGRVSLLKSDTRRDMRRD